MDEKQLQEKYMEYKLLEQQMTQIQKQIQMIENQLTELASVNEGLDELKNVKEGTEILVPVSNGIFTKAALKDNGNLIINVGSNIAVNKKFPEAKELIQTQLTEMQKMHDHMNSELEKLAQKAGEVEQELSSMVSENKE